MSAYFETGFSVRQPMWHGLGSVLDEPPADWDEARMAAGLMWEPTYLDLYVPRRIDIRSMRCRTCDQQLEHVEDCPLGAEDSAVFMEQCFPEGSRAIDENGDGYTGMVPVDGFRAIARDDTLDVLATPTDSFELIYHSQMGELLEAFAGTSLRFETAGSLRGGRSVWALVWLDEPFTVPGDDSPTFPFGALLNHHDGQGACKLVRTSVRIVCWNTWQAADYQAEANDQQVVIRHAGNVTERLEVAARAASSMRTEAKAWAMAAADLASIRVDDAIVRTFLDEFIPIPEAASERTRDQRAERQAAFRKLWTDSPTVAPLPDTAYKLVQAAGEWLDHVRPFRSADTYLARTMLKPEPIKAGVVKLVRELTAVQ